MGTRSLTVITGRGDQEIAVMYRQFDGYPSGHGAELKEAFADFRIVNGMRGDDPPKIANGMDCLAAQIIAHFKKKPGGFYLYPAGSRDCGEEYTYALSERDHRIWLDLTGYEKFSGFLDDFDPAKVEIEAA